MGAEFGEYGREEGQEFNSLLGDALVDDGRGCGECEGHAEAGGGDADCVDGSKPRGVGEEGGLCGEVVEGGEFVGIWGYDVCEGGAGGVGAGGGGGEDADCFCSGDGLEDCGGARVAGGLEPGAEGWGGPVCVCDEDAGSVG